MLKKLLFVYVFLFAYSGAILHGIVPHHHHDSVKEATEHHHHKSDHNNSHHHDKKDNNKHDDSGSLHFLTHGANADVTIGHSAEQGIAKIKKTEKQVGAYSLFVIFKIVPSQKIFHPPSDDSITDNSCYLFRALRAPPISIC
jgi:hypothetical protein